MLSLKNTKRLDPPNCTQKLNATQQRGYIAVNVVQPQLIAEEDPCYGAIQNGESVKWQFRFVPFTAISSDISTVDFYFQLLKSDPYQMPVIFVDTVSVVAFGSNLYDANKSIFVSFFVDLNPEVKQVVNDEKVRRENTSKVRQQPEQKLEYELYDWLRIKGVEVERQVVTAKHRLDLWIPNKAMIELKQGRVSGDDVCQAIDYAATYQMPIVLVGTGLSSAASRGIDGFNRAMSKDLIIFVTWGGVKPYLSGILSLR